MKVKAQAPSEAPVLATDYAKSEHISAQATYRRVRDCRLRAKWDRGRLLVYPSTYRPKQKRPWHGAPSQPPFQLPLWPELTAEMCSLCGDHLAAGEAGRTLCPRCWDRRTTTDFQPQHTHKQGETDASR